MRAKGPRGRSYWTELDERWGQLTPGMRRYIGVPPSGRLIIVTSSVDVENGVWRLGVSAALPDGPERPTDAEVDFALTSFAMANAGEVPTPSRRPIRHFVAAPDKSKAGDAPESPTEPESSDG